MELNIEIPESTEGLEATLAVCAELEAILGIQPDSSGFGFGRRDMQFPTDRKSVYRLGRLARGFLRSKGYSVGRKIDQAHVSIND